MSHTPECESVLDAFSGSGVVAYEYKRQGKRVIANDLLTSSYYFSKATVENNDTKLSDEEIEGLFATNDECQPYLQEQYAGVLYPVEECRFLDNLHANISELGSPYKRSIAFAAAVRTCIYKMPGGKFRPNLLPYRSPSHQYHKPKFLKPIEEVYRSFLQAYNLAVFDNGQDNLALNSNILDAVSNIEVDLAYFDPPYGGSDIDYLRDYFFVELYTRDYGQPNELRGEVKRHEDPRRSGFRLSGEAGSSLKRLFEHSVHIPWWIVSYNNRGIPAQNELIQLLRRYRSSIQIVSRDYAYKGGDNRRLQELLLICH